MTMPTITTRLAGEEVVLLPERALYWPQRSTLLIADMHWGKAATLRAAAIAIPGGSTSDDLARLSRAIERSDAQRLIVLGDLIHARAGRAPATLAAFSTWRRRHATLEIVLVRGNHDRRAGDPPAELEITCVDPPHCDPPFVLLHEPDAPASGYGLAGHLHPAVRLRGAGRQRLTLACFWFSERMGVLPAFGSLTGAATVAPGAGDRVFVLADDAIVAVQ